MHESVLSAARAAGFLISHSLYKLADIGEGLIPQSLAILPDGSRQLRVWVHENFEGGVAAAREWRDANPEQAQSIAVAFDGRIQSSAGRMVDAVIVEIRGYAYPFELTAAQPYTPARPSRGLGLVAKARPLVPHRTKVMEWSGLEEAEVGEVFDALVQGNEDHEAAQSIWANYDDLSV